MNRIERFVLAALIVVCGFNILHAGLISKPFTFSPSTVASSSQANANFDTIYTVINGNLGTANLEANSVGTSELIANSVNFDKLDWGTGASQIRGTETTTWRLGQGGANYIDLASPALTGNRTWTLQDSDDTFVGRATTDTLTNKTLTSPTLTSPSLSNPSITGTVSGGATYSAPTITGPSITGTVGGSASYTSPTITGPSITGTVGGSASYTTPTITSPSITGTVGGSASYTTPTITSPTITGPTITGNLNLGTAGVMMTDDGDGAITWLGLGNGFDEDLTLNLDDVSNTGTFSSSTSLATLNFSSIALQESGVGVVNTGEIDTSSEIKSIVTDETGSGALVFGTSPTLTTPSFSSIVNTGTLTLPTSTDTLVGRATTDTLTNKTLTSPTISSPTMSGTVGGALSWSGTQTLSAGATILTSGQSLKMGANAKIYTDGGTDDYITNFATSDIMAFVVGGLEVVEYRITSGGLAAFQNDISYVGTITDVSDSRLKKDITPINLGLDYVNKLKPVSYVMKEKDGRTHYGFIAQDVESVTPDENSGLVSSPNKDRKYYGLDYNQFIAPMVKSIQELSKKVTDLESQCGAK